MNNNEDFFEELTIFHETVYHPLPDGKYIEYQIKDNYTEELSNISSEILKIRQYHVLYKALLKNKEKSSTKKFKFFTKFLL